MNDRTSTEIQRDIEQTRAEMSHTIDAIQERLSPGQLIDQAIWHLRSGGANEFAANLGRTIRDNPVPVLLVGTGLVWLMVASARRGHEPYGDYSHEYYDEDTYAGHYGSPEELARRYDERMGRREEERRAETDPAYAGHYGSAPGPYGSASSTPQAADRTAERPGMTGSTVGAAAVNPPGGGGSGDGRAQSASERARQAADEARERAAHAAGGPEYSAHTAGPATGSHEKGKAGRDDEGDWRDEAREGFEHAGERARQGMEEARHGFEHAGERARHGMHEARESMGRAADYARDRARRARSQARRRTRGMGNALSRLLHEQPLLVGAIGLAVGAAIGALIPATRRESEWMGEAADEVKHRAREEAMRARRVAERAVEAAREEAERQGLTPEGMKEEWRSATHAAGEKLRETQRDIGDSVKRTAEEKLHEAKESAKDKLRETQDEARAKAEETGDRVRKVGEAAKEAAKDEAKRQDLGGSSSGSGQTSSSN